MKGTCAICDSERVRKIRNKFEARYNQVPVLIEKAEMYQCESCGKEFFTAKQSRELSRQIKHRVREEAGLLSPERIVEIRKDAGLSQNDLEELFGLGEKVVTRWENGRVIQGRTADVALRFLEMDPSLVAGLRTGRKPRVRSTPAGVVSTPLTADFLLYGAFHAAHQSWHLLEDAVVLFRNRSYPVSLALSVFSLEEIGRAKFYLEQREAVLAGQPVTTEILTGRRTRNHVWKLAQADIPVSVGVASAGSPPRPGSAEESALGERLIQLRKVMEENAPRRAHAQRLSALYVDVHPNGVNWVVPSRMIRKEESEEKLGAADLAYALFRLRLAEPEPDSDIALAVRRLGNLPKLPEAPWDSWTWAEREPSAVANEA
jgi:putative zinc finger/helix-turn-helix YgiT family protein/AbiV family abortive infection protein